MGFQRPFGSLNPRLTIGQTLAEPMEIHFPGRTAADRRERAAALLQKVGLNPDYLGRRPREFSGGQSRSQRWTCRSRPRWSICCRICRRNWD